MLETCLLAAHNCNYYDQTKKNTKAKELLRKFSIADQE